jgi:ferritin
MTNLLADKTSYSDAIQQLFQVLNPKEKKVIMGRYGFDIKSSKRTLESIGEDLSITRERVRQIQKAAIKKLQRVIHSNKLHATMEFIEHYIKENDYFVSEENLIKDLSQKIKPEIKNIDSLIVLLADIHNEITKIKKTKKISKAWSIKLKLSQKDINTIIKAGVKILKAEKKALTPIHYLTEVQNELKNQKDGVYSRSTLAKVYSATTVIRKVQEGYGLTQWRSIKPKSIKDKSIIVFKRQNKPLHFSQVCDLIHDASFDEKRVTLQAVHNELIRYEEFVLIGRGIYALQEWGFKTGTVKDIIHEVLAENGPLSKAKIIEEVLKERKVKVGTISLNLQKHPEFKRVGRAVYSL